MIYLPLDFLKIKNGQGKKPRKFDVSDTDLIITIGWLLILPCNNNNSNIKHSLWFFVLIAVPYPHRPAAINKMAWLLKLPRTSVVYSNDYTKYSDAAVVVFVATTVLR